MHLAKGVMDRGIDLSYGTRTLGRGLIIWERGSTGMIDHAGMLSATLAGNHCVCTGNQRLTHRDPAVDEGLQKSRIVVSGANPQFPEVVPFTVPTELFLRITTSLEECRQKRVSDVDRISGLTIDGAWRCSHLTEQDSSQQTLWRHQLVGSMGQVGSAGDNAARESFFSLLQKRVLNRRRWETRDQLRLVIVAWIERTYHRRRRQNRLGRLTPIEYELIMSKAADQAA